MNQKASRRRRVIGPRRPQIEFCSIGPTVLYKRKSWAWRAGYFLSGFVYPPPIRLGPAAGLLSAILLQVIVRTVIHHLH